jgi:hypothetical protein
MALIPLARNLRLGSVLFSSGEITLPARPVLIKNYNFGDKVHFLNPPKQPPLEGGIGAGLKIFNFFQRFCRNVLRAMQNSGCTPAAGGEGSRFLSILNFRGTVKSRKNPLQGRLV